MTKTLNDLISFFDKCGGTDYNYLNAHFARFQRTYDFVVTEGLQPSVILDIGCHWLHLSAFFANNNNTIICSDAPNTIRQDCVKIAASKLNISLVSYTRLDLGEGLSDLEDDSVDLILMSEILEHLAFNPLVFWKEVYRVLKVGGRIIITTPNSLYFKSVLNVYSGVINGSGVGCNINEIFDTGTYGHHWKEFSVNEIPAYFNYMDCGFSVTKLNVETIGRSQADETELCNRMVKDVRCDLVDFNKIFDSLEREGAFPYGNQIFAEITLVDKTIFTKAPPWLVE